MEIRDPIHVFIRLEDYEKVLLDCRPMQRLRHVYQLATTSWICPGASHRRFEHSLGTMELATRIFDAVVQKLPPRLEAPRGDELRRWRCILRAAALCHDIGHLPFSHAAEQELLPEGVSHEILGRRILESEHLSSVWARFPFTIDPLDVAKLAMGAAKIPDQPFTSWELLLSEIITADALGADRMDYLLRDSYHAGVAYGRFDHYRLIETMRVLELPEAPDAEEPRFQLGVEEGGLVAAEALLLARYQMYSQVYFHKTRRILDIHLKDFLQAWLPGGRFPATVEGLLELDDNRVLAELAKASSSRPDHRGHDAARMLLNREHFRALYHRNPTDQKRNPKALWVIGDAAKEKFGERAVRVDPSQEDKRPTRQAVDFPVLTPSGEVLSSSLCSPVAQSVPPVDYGFVFIDPKHREKAKKWLKKEKQTLLGRTPNQEEVA